MTRNKPQIRVQKRTYCPFETGLAPDRLRIGGLYLDPMNPANVEDLRFDYRFPEFQKREQYEQYLHDKGWCFDDDIVANFHTSFTQSSDRNFAATLTSALDVHHSSDRLFETSLTGDAGRRIALRMPKRFFEKDVMSQEGAEEWLIKQATIIKSSLPRALRKAEPTWKPPKVWLCTGLQMVKGGSYATREHKASSNSAQIQADPSPALGMPPGSLRFGVNVAWSKAKGSETSYTFEGERIWAAEFTQLEVRYSADADPKDKNRPALVMSCEVQPIPDFGDGAVRWTPKNRGNEDSADERQPSDNVDIVMAEVSQDGGNSENVLSIDGGFGNQFADVDWTRYHKAKKWLDNPGARTIGNDATAGADRS